ncbi:MAG: ABC transporter permease [Elusimicrobia bacterium]|nr:ABC transporter permease [Elusimicrobiota bacterium]
MRSTAVRKAWLRRGMFYLALLGLWELVFRCKVWPPYLFPSPQQVADAIIAGFQDRTLPIGIAISLRRIGIGYGCSIVLGMVLGLMTARNRVFEETVGSLILALQALPSVCWLPAALLWFGLNDQAILFVVLMGATLAMAIAAHDGVKGIPPIYIKAAQTMGTRGLHLYTRVLLPASLPAVITGMKQGWSFAWRSLMAGELLFVSLGLGHLLQMGRELNDIAQVFAVIVVIVVIGLVVDQGVFAPVERRVRMRWGLTLPDWK